MNGKNMYFGTTGLLKTELENINSKEWKATPEEIVKWSTTEGYPTDMTIKAKNMVFKENEIEDKENDDNKNDKVNNNINDSKDNNNIDDNNSNDIKSPQKSGAEESIDTHTVIHENSNENSNKEVTWCDNENFKIVHHEIHDTYDPLSLAKFAFSIMWQAAEFSIKHRVLIIYDS